MQEWIRQGKRDRAAEAAQIVAIIRWLEKRSWTSTEDIGTHFNIGRRQVYRIINIVERIEPLQVDYDEFPHSNYTKVKAKRLFVRMPKLSST